MARIEAYAAGPDGPAAEGGDEDSSWPQMPARLPCYVRVWYRRPDCAVSEQEAGRREGCRRRQREQAARCEAAARRGAVAGERAGRDAAYGKAWADACHMLSGQEAPPRRRKEEAESRRRLVMRASALAWLGAAKRGNSTALVEASKAGHAGAVASLLRSGAAAPKQGPAPLSCAALRGHRRAVARLIQQGAGAGGAGGAGGGLRAAAAAGHTDVVSLLCIHSPPTVDAADARGWTALHHAAHAACPDACVVLLKQGADARARTTVAVRRCAAGATPLHLCCAAAGRTAARRETARTLFHWAADTTCERVRRARPQWNVHRWTDAPMVDARDDAGMTPLGLAAAQGHDDVVELLLLFGAVRELRDDGGLTAAQRAAERARALEAEIDASPSAASPGAEAEPFSPNAHARAGRALALLCNDTPPTTCPGTPKPLSSGRSSATDPYESERETE